MMQEGADLGVAQDGLKEQIAAQYGVNPADVELVGGRRRLENDLTTDHRRLQVQVTFVVTQTGSGDSAPIDAPSQTALRGAIAAGANVPPSSLEVDDPAEAAVATQVEYTVTVTQNAGTDSSAVTAALADTSTLSIPGVDAADIVQDTEGVVVVDTTLTAEAVPVGVTAAPAESVAELPPPTPPPPARTPSPPPLSGAGPAPAPSPPPPSGAGPAPAAAAGSGATMTAPMAAGGNAVVAATLVTVAAVAYM
jgi:hypothetical protein